MKKLKINNIKYPDDFFDFSNGVEISEERIRGYIEEIISDGRLSEFSNGDVSALTIGTGNTIVIGLFYKSEKNKINVELYVCSNYKHFENEFKL